MTSQPNPATSGEVLAAVMAFKNDQESARAVGRQSIISSPDYAAQRFAMSRLSPAIQAQLEADEAAFRAAYEALSLPPRPRKTGSQDATDVSTGYHAWRVSPGGGSERHICSVPDEAYGRRYVEWLNTHPNNRRLTTPEAPVNDRFELRLGTLTIYAPPLPIYTEVRSWRERDEPFPG